jgi:hypothetical protein
MAKFIIVGDSEKKAGILVNIDHIKFMHVMKLEEKKFAVQIIFGTNESYVSEPLSSEKKAMKLFDDIYLKIYGLIGPESIEAFRPDWILDGLK